MMLTTGLNKRQLADWFTKARRKMKAEGRLSGDICRIKDVKLLVNNSSSSSSNIVVKKKPSFVRADAYVNVETTMTKKPSFNRPVDMKPDVGLSEYAKSYLERWYETHSSHPFPTKRQKERMLIDMGLLPEDMKKMEGWLSRKRVRSRKRLKQWNYSEEMKETTIVEEEKKSLDHTTEKVAVEKPKPSSVPPKSQPTSAEVDNYLYEWMSRPCNQNNFAPKQTERKVMETESGIEDRRIESWFYRLRKRLKRQAEKEGLSVEELMRGLGGVLRREREERLGSCSSTNDGEGVLKMGEGWSVDGLGGEDDDGETEESLADSSVEGVAQVKEAEVQSMRPKQTEQCQQALQNREASQSTQPNQSEANQEREPKPDMKKSDEPTATQIQDLGGLAVLASVATKAQPVPPHTNPINVKTIQSILTASEVTPTRMVSPQLSIGSDSASVSEVDSTWESSRCVSPSLCEFYEMYR